MLKWLRKERKIVERERLNLAGIIVVRDHVDYALGIAGGKNQEIILLNGQPVFKRQILFENYETTNVEVDSPIFDVRLYRQVGLIITNKVGNPATMRCYVSNDCKNWCLFGGSANIGIGTYGYYYELPFAFFKWSLFSTYADTPAIISMMASAKR